LIAGKLIAGLLGLLVAGIPGLVFGIVVGHLFDRGLASVFGAGAAGAAVVREEFFRAIFVLMGYIAKADGRVSEEEVAHTQALFHQLNLNDEQRNQAILLFKKGSDPAFNPELTAAEFLQRGGGHPILKRTLFMFLVSLALADHELHSAEREALLRIGALLGYDAGSVEEALRMATAQEHFHREGGAAASPRASLADAYIALGVEEHASDTEIKRAYRKLMSQNHPDKLSAKGVPPEMLRLATEKSQEIQGAYELIRKTRGSGR